MLLAFMRGVLEHTPSSSQEEHSQILQTIEMFEAITQTQPDDYQSLEILKEAYHKVGRQEESLRMSRRLAEAYFNVGSYTLAMQECDVLLMKEPNSPEVLAMLGEIETKLQAAGQVIAAKGAKNGSSAPNDLLGGKGDSNGTLMESGGRGALTGRVDSHQLLERGDDHLAKFLIVQQLFPEEQVTAALESVTMANTNLNGQALAASLLDHMCGPDVDKLEAVLSSLIDRTKFAYVPLEYYDIDRQIVRMLPDTLTLGRLFVPFDLISRTIMVACCNPFDAAGREAVQQSLDYSVAWYLARPAPIAKILQETYRLESRA